MIFWFHSLRQSYVWHAKPRDDTGSCDTAAASTRAYSFNCTRFSPVADRIDCLCCVDQDTRSTRQLINKLPVKDLRESSVIPWYKFGPSGVQKMLSTCRWLASLVNKQPGLDGSCGWPPRRLCQRYYRPREACATLVSAAQPLPGIVRIAVSPQSPTLRIASRDMSNSHQVPVLACQRHIPRYLICSHARICRMPVTSTAWKPLDRPTCIADRPSLT